MTDSANFRAAVDSLTAFPAYGRKHHDAIAVEYANSVDTLLFRDGFHDGISRLAIIGQHGVPGGACNAAGKLIGPDQHGRQELFFLIADIDQPGHDRDDYDDSTAPCSLQGRHRMDRTGRPRREQAMRGGTVPRHRPIGRPAAVKISA